MITLYLLLIILTIGFIRYLWSQRRWYFLSWKLSAPIGLPFLGNVTLFWNRDYTFDRISFFRKIYKTTFGFWLGPKFVVYLYNPDDIETILNHPECLDKGDLYKFVGNVLGPGIFMSTKEIWSRKRKLINPSFSHKVLVSFFPVFNRELDTLIENFENHVDKGDICVNDFIMRCNLDISCKTTMGATLNTQKMMNGELLNAYVKAKFIVGKRIFTPWLQPDFVFRLSKYYNLHENTKNLLGEFVDNLIESKCSTDNSVEPVATEKLAINEDSITKNGNIFIDQAIKLVQNKQFTWTDVVNESNIIVAAAFDTTALTITYLIQCLAMHPEHQEKVIEEICSVCPNKDADITYEDTKQMTYCDLVINETLRLFPGVPMLTRRIRKDITLKGDIVVPQGTEIIIDIIGMHRDQNIWGPTANMFDPLRFCDLRKDIHPYMYIPFSKGPRNCIGWRYSLMSLKVFMARIFRRFRFTTDQKWEDMKLRMDITLVSVNVPLVKIHKI